MKKPKKPKKLPSQTEGEYNAVLRKYEKELLKWNLENNPEQLQNESDEDYKDRTAYFEYKRKKGRSFLDALWEDKVKTPQKELSYLPNLLSEIATSPVDIAYYLSNKIDISDTEKNKSEKIKRSDDIDFVDSLTDAITLVAPWKLGAKAPPIINQAGKKLGKETIQEGGFDLLQFMNDNNIVDTMKKNKKQKYSLGTGKNGVVRHYIESPDETITESQIMLAKAREKAMSNSWGQGLDIFGNMAMQYGMSKAGGSNGVIKGIGQGFGNMFGKQQAAFGGPIGPGRKKIKKRDLTEEEIAAKVIEQNKKDVFDPNEILFTAEGLSEIFGGEDVTYEETPEIDLGKYGKVGYFKVDKDGAGDLILNNTKKNPANIDLYKEQKDYIRRRNPNAKFANEGFTPLINQKAFGGSIDNVNVEVEGQEVGETPDGQLIDFQGPSHENGGIDVNLPEGTEIFSKRIKVRGETMAERKIKRENKLLTLEKLLEKNKEDNILKNSIKRTIKNNKKEEEKDQNIQDVIRGMKQITQLAYGTGPDGVETYRDGGSVIKNFFKGLFGKDNNSTIDPITGFDPEYAKKQMGVFKSDNASNTTGILDSDEILGVTDYSGNDRIEARTKDNEVPLKNNNNFLTNFTGGDLLGLAGTAFSAFQPMKNTQANRAGDTPNINAFEDFGNDALDRMEEAKGYIAGQRDKALSDVETSRTRITTNNRNTARGVNTMRALDLASEVNANRAEGDIYDNFSKQMMQMLSQQAGFENQQDQAVMTGEQNRDLADREDRDNYYSQMAQDIASKGEGIQTIGKMLNQNKKNTMSEKAVNALSKYGFLWDESGNLVDKAGNPVTEEQKQALKTLGIIKE